MKPCGYFRISGEDTALDKFAVEKYTTKFLDYGIPKKYIFYDFSSGGNTHREGYKQVIWLLKNGDRDELVVPMQSRLNRNLINSELLAEEIVGCKAKLTVLESGTTLDLELPAHRLLYQIQSMFDHQVLTTYRQQNKDNAVARRRNNKLNAVPFGYGLTRGVPYLDREPYLCTTRDKKVYSPADVLLKLIETIISSKNMARSVREVHSFFGVLDHIPLQIKHKDGKKPRQFDFSSDLRFKNRKKLHFSHNSVKKLLSHPLLCGDVKYFWRNGNIETIDRPQAYPEAAIISRQLFNRLQNAMTNRDYDRTGKKNLPYTGLVYCAACGGRYYSHPGKKRKDGTRNSRYFCRDLYKGCNSKSIKAAKIEKAVIKELTARYNAISNLAISEDNSSEKSPKIIKLKKELYQLEQINSQSEFIVKAIVDARKKIQTLYQEESLGSQVKQENIELLDRTFANPMYWETLGDEDKREINQMLIKKIVIGLKDGESFVESIILSI